MEPRVVCGMLLERNIQLLPVLGSSAKKSRLTRVCSGAVSVREPWITRRLCSAGPNRQMEERIGLEKKGGEGTTRGCGEADMVGTRRIRLLPTQEAGKIRYWRNR